MRDEIQQRLSMARAVADDPSTLFCAEPFAAAERDGGERLGTLLARVMASPDHALIVATGKAFVFAFGDQVGRHAGAGKTDTEAADGRP